MPKFRKKPVVIEAIQWTGFTEEFEAICKLGDTRVINEDFDLCQIQIETLEGTMVANEGDWIIKGVKGELYPCKPDIFEQTYETVED